MGKVKTAIGQLVDIGIALAALFIVIGVLFGTGQLSRFGADVVGNLISLFQNQFLGQGLVGLVVLGIVLWLFSNRNKP